MTRGSITSRLTLAVLCGIVAFLFYQWATLPVLETVTLQSWRWIGAAAAGVGSGIGTALIRQWLRVVMAVGTGLVVGAALVEGLAPNDVALGILGSLAAGIANFGVDIGRLLSAVGLGAFIVRLLSRPATAGSNVA